MYEITVGELTVQLFQGHVSFYKIIKRKNPVPLPLAQKPSPNRAGKKKKRITEIEARRESYIQETVKMIHPQHTFKEHF